MALKCCILVASASFVIIFLWNSVFKSCKVVHIFMKMSA